MSNSFVQPSRGSVRVAKQKSVLEQDNKQTVLTFTIRDKVSYCVETSLWTSQTGVTSPHLYTALIDLTNPEKLHKSQMKKEIKRLREANEISQETTNDLMTELKMLTTIREVSPPPLPSSKKYPPI